MKTFLKASICSACLLIGFCGVSAADSAMQSDSNGNGHSSGSNGNGTGNNHGNGNDHGNGNGNNNGSVIADLKSIKVVASTVPANGDVNPYGMALVRHTMGNLNTGHILVSNFNNSANQQGTGTTIVDIAPDGTTSVFATLDAKSLPGSCPGGVGLTTALVVLSQGWVIVGSLPTMDGTAATAQGGCLIVLDNMGKPVETFFGSLLDGPWDMTSFDRGDTAVLFVSTVLNDTVAGNGKPVLRGTVVRLNLKLTQAQMPALAAITVVGSEFAERTDPAALVIGPTGLALSPSCSGDEGNACDAADTDASRDSTVMLYVADTLANRIAVIDHPFSRTTSARTGQTLTTGGSLNGPLGMVATPLGHLLTVNGGNGVLTEIDHNGNQIAKSVLDSTGTPPGAGTLFGLVFDPGSGVYFVNDGTNTMNLLH